MLSQPCRITVHDNNEKYAIVKFFRIRITNGVCVYLYNLRCNICFLLELTNRSMTDGFSEEKMYENSCRQYIHVVYYEILWCTQTTFYTFRPQ